MAIFRRGYSHPDRPSDETRLPSDEQSAQWGDLEGQNKILVNMGLELATFLDGYIAKSRIPPAQNGKGGIAVLGWSLGSLSVHALLANLDKVPVETVATLDKYIHTTILQGTSLQNYL